MMLMPSLTHQSAVIELRDVAVVFDNHTVLKPLSVRFECGQRWIVMGPNGCGKTTLLRVLSLYLHPSRGDIAVAGQSLGTFDVRTARARLAYMSASLTNDLRPALSAHDVVMTARYGALETWWHDYTDADSTQADSCLERLGVLGTAQRSFGSLSSGEQQRVLIARALMNNPLALLLDEPSAQLDLGGRHYLVSLLDECASTMPDLVSVLATHHVEEIPTSTTHALLLRDGEVIGAGPIDETLTSSALSTCFEMQLVVQTRPNGRLTAHALD